MDHEGDGTLLWQRRYEELMSWYNTHGNCNVPKAEGRLGRWVVRQRELYKKGKLESVRKALLDELSFVWNTNEAAWESRYNLLCQYASHNGHCCVPISDPTLGMWVAKMRANRRRGKLPDHRKKKLDALGFVWNTAEADWMDKYERLLEFRQSEGHACVPFNKGELGWWVNTQRQSKRKGKLSKERERLLNAADFIWKPQEFLAMRRRGAHHTRSNAAHFRADEISATNKRTATTAFANESPDFSILSFDSCSPKRMKTSASIPSTPLHQKSLSAFAEFDPSSSSEHSKLTDRKEFGTEPITQAPVSHANLLHLGRERSNATSPVESISSTRMDRSDMSSIASLLSPTSDSSVAPLHSFRGQDMSTTSDQEFLALPDFRSSGTLAALSRRQSFPQRFALPPISSLLQMTSKPRV